MSPAVSAEPLWQISALRFLRPPADWPREPFDLAIPRGRTALLGESGSGKTSLIEVLVGFAKQSAGSVHCPATLAWSPQDHGLWHAHTVREHLTLVGASAAESDALLAEFDLGRMAECKAATLSLGEAARLSVARALAQKAPVVVMDEPLAHVDSARSGKYWRAIRDHIARTEASFLFATHAPEIALDEADHAICLREGSPVFSGPVADLYERPASEELANFLGPANWLTPADAHTWLGKNWPAARCIRPERLVIVPEEEATSTVLASRFFGAYAETELRMGNGNTRAFIHRPPEAPAFGTRVRIGLTGTNRP